MDKHASLQEPFDIARHLSAAAAALTRPDVDTARQLAQQALKLAETHGLRREQAQCLMLLAHCDRLFGRYRRVHDTSQQAARLYALEGDLAGELEALSLLCQACSFIGRDEEAVETGLLSVQLGEGMRPGVEQVLNLNYLGMAYFWSGAYAHARETLELAATRAKALVPPRSALQPSLNLVWTEVVRMARDRYFLGKRPNAGDLQLALEKVACCLAENAPPLLPGGNALFTMLAGQARTLALCWSGRPKDALQELDSAMADRDEVVRQAGAVTECWLRAEIAWAAGTLQQACRLAHALVDTATRAEFEQMAYLGHAMVAQLHELLGEPTAALAALKELRLREHRVRSERIDSRMRAVTIQLEVRRTERNLALLQRHSRELERLSFEDDLTGLPNRRRFEQALTDLMGAGLDPVAPLCVAVVDLDDFKNVNDRFTHAGGDDVLKGVAQVLRQAVRDTDIAARLAGDEFVLLFPRTELEQAQAICARIRETVASMPWEVVGAGLRVTVTIGLAQAMDGDTPVSLLHRSDVAMFAAKRG